MRDCEKGHDRHERCRATQEARKSWPSLGISLPTRLIEIRSSDNEYQLRLRDSGQMAGNEQYMTLSHCWGNQGSMKVRLTMDSLESFRNEIDFSTLPRTFQDAIRVVQSFENVHHLWIDALCIVQDSGDDWLRESSSMADVYANSFLNIAATAGTNSESGLFYTRPEVLPEDVIEVSTTWSGDLVTGQYICYGFDFRETNIDKMPLCQRAWVVQERELAPRILHFGATHLFWECSCLIAMDSLPGGLDAGVHLKSRWPGMVEWDQKSWRGGSPYDYWPELVVRYSACKLTYGSDKLIAVSALARAMMSLLKTKGLEDVYLAGLWKNDLQRGLLWSTNNGGFGKPSGGTRVQTEMPSPSWSWTCIDGAEMWYPNQNAGDIGLLRLQKATTEVLSVCTYPVGDEFGPVNGGILRLQGPLCKVGYSSDRHQWTINGMLRGLHKRVFWDSKEEVQGVEGELVLMVILTNENNIIHGRVQGLLLCLTGKCWGQYTRVGRLDLEFGDKHTYTPEDSKTWSAMDMAPEYYEESNSEGRYTISVI